MQANHEVDGDDVLRTFRAELAAALGDSWDWSDLDPESGTTPLQMEDSSSGSMLPTQQPPGFLQNVTAGVARADMASSNEGADGVSSLCADNAPRKQLWVGLPQGFAGALRQLPERLRAHTFIVAVFESLGDSHIAAEFLAAAVQLERAGNILRQALHLGLPAELSEQVRRLSRWISQACNLQRDDCEPNRFRLALSHAHTLLALKPRKRDEFVRLALSFTRERISLNRLVSEEYRIRIACDCIICNLEAVPTVVPVAEIVALIVALEEIREGGAP